MCCITLPCFPQCPLHFDQSPHSDQVAASPSLLKQSGFLSANPDSSQLLCSKYGLGHGFPPYLGYMEGLLVLKTGTKVEMVN